MLNAGRVPATMAKILTMACEVFHVVRGKKRGVDSGGEDEGLSLK